MHEPAQQVMPAVPGWEPHGEQVKLFVAVLGGLDLIWRGGHFHVIAKDRLQNRLHGIALKDGAQFL